MKREQAIPYVSYVVDDAGCGRALGEDMHAVVRASSRLVGWQCGFEPLFVAVHSYLDTQIEDADAEDIAAEYLQEIGWFSNGRKDADYII